MLYNDWILEHVKASAFSTVKKKRQEELTDVAKAAKIEDELMHEQADTEPGHTQSKFRSTRSTATDTTRHNSSQSQNFCNGYLAGKPVQ